MSTTLGAHVKDADLRQLFKNALTSHFVNAQKEVHQSNESDTDKVEQGEGKRDHNV